MIKEYIKYLKDNPQEYWFKAKLYGWGWTPVKWQGWCVIFLYIVLILGLVLVREKDVPGNPDSGSKYPYVRTTDHYIDHPSHYCRL